MCLCANIMTSASDCQTSREGWDNRRKNGDFLSVYCTFSKKLDRKCILKCY